MPALIVLFVAIQVLEIWILVQVAHAIGAVDTLLLLVVEAVLGAALLRREGRRAWLALRSALRSARVPAREVADGALVLLGGALLITPGLLSDLAGVLCLLPPTRAVLRPALTRLVARRLGLGAADRGTQPRGGRVVDGETVRRWDET